MKHLRSLPFAVLAILVAACGSGSGDGAQPAGGSPENGPGPSDGDGGTTTTQPPPPSDGGAGDALDLQSDPKNCGAQGHSCLGAACSAGTCTPEVVRAGGIVRWFAFDETGALVTDIESLDKSAESLRRGAATPNASDTVLFTGDFTFFQLGGYAGGALFYSEFADLKDSLVRWSGSGGAPGVRQVVDGPATLVYQFALDATHVFFWNNRGLYRSTLAGADKTRLGGTSLDVSNSGVVLDDDSAFVVALSAPPTTQSKRVISRVSKTTGAVVETTPTGIALDEAFLAATTPTRVIGDTTTQAGFCASQETTIWSVPKGGGSATVLYTSTSGQVPMIKTSGEYVYWARNGCSKSETSQLFRRRADGSDAAVVLVDAKVRFDVIGVDGTYVYWNDIGLYRTPK